ncbi:MAG TPA: cysteine desulfurase [Longimicrobiales bacterium]|nr:cysteine desulfurase [Longimicrobiales bacterium]
MRSSSTSVTDLATTAAPYDVAAVRGEFPILSGSTGDGRPLVYLDNAATSQKPRAVIDALTRYYERDNANVHRGLYDLSRRATEAYERARHRMARFVNAPSAEEVVWLRGATEAINLIAQSWGAANLRPGDEIVLTLLEHHSNIVPWQLAAERAGARVRFVDIDDQGRIRMDELAATMSERTRIVSVGHVSNAIGTIHPIREIVDLAHAAGAIVVVDGAQGAPHLKVDVQALGCDFYALSGHKMCGPMGIGILWGRRELLDAMAPYQGGGEMIDVVTTEGSTYKRAPHRFEAGTPNVGGAIALAAAADFLDGLGHDALWAHEQELTRYGLERLGAVDSLHVFGPQDPAERTAVFSFRLDDVHPHDVATIVDAEGVAVRAGHHCCQPLMRRLGVPATTRASCYLYNTTDEIDRLAEALVRARDIFG